MVLISEVMTSQVSEARRAFGSGRMTSQRAIIVAAAGEMGGAFTVDDLAMAARGRDAAIGVATVYRAVSALEGTGWLERVG